MSRVEVRAVHDSPGELWLRRVLLRLLDEYDLSTWSWVRDVRIDQELGALGQCLREDGRHVIRLRAGKLEPQDPDAEVDLSRFPKLLPTYLHEQLHAHLDMQEERTQAAIHELRSLYPDVPVGPPDGAHSDHSTYLHLLLCTLELDGTASLIGEDHARALRADPPFYRFIYRTVLDDTEQLRAIIRRHGLEPQRTGGLP